MALKIFDNVMNFLGLVETGSNGKNNVNRGGAEDDFERIDRTRSKNVKNSTKNNSRRANEDEFDDEPRITYVPRRASNSGTGGSSSATRRAAQNDTFEAEDIWGDESARPEYGVRSGSSAQSSQRGSSSGRYAAQQSGYGSSQSGYRPYQGASQNDYRPGGSSRGGYTDTNYYGGENTMNYAGNDQPRSNNGGQKHQMAMFRIKTVDECKNVIRTLLEKKSVLLSLEEMDSVQAQRVVDTMSGATFAIGAKMNRASARSWLLTPSTVEVDDKHALGSNTIL